ncbi:hypothetical protein QE152_g18134 [Popillia japonica]|uniref:Endonuclease/exonuclease/phosphatase domain-containing protein n=1 Tax=Popillia japonica TaxID=7064 RepID=A0AAW1L4E4_POPJA
MNRLLFICGDFNINFSIASIEQQAILNLMAEFGMTMVIREFTRITAQTQTTIDNIFTNLDLSDISWIVGDTHISDHRYIGIDINELYLSEINRTMIVEKRIFSDENKRQFAYFLSREQWTDVYENSDINDKFSAFLNILTFHFNNAFPYKRIKTCTQYRSSWVTELIKESSRKLNDLFILQKSFPQLREV